MGVKFLSEEWTQAATDSLNAHDGFASAIANVDLGIQFKVTDTPNGGDIDYHVDIGEGRADVKLGEAGAPDVSVTNDYVTASAVSNGDLNMQTAFMTGKLKVSGNLAKLMMHQAALTHLAGAVSAMDVDY